MSGITLELMEIFFIGRKLIQVGFFFTGCDWLPLQEDFISTVSSPPRSSLSTEAKPDKNVLQHGSSLVTEDKLEKKVLKRGSYIEMIAKCLLEKRKATVDDIYYYFTTNFPEVVRRSTTESDSWKNIVRHNLTACECFIKTVKSVMDKGYYWTIHPNYMERFQRGVFKSKSKYVKKKRVKKSNKKVHVSKNGVADVGNKSDKKNVKPDVPYIEMIARSMLASKSGTVELRDVTAYIKQTYPNFVKDSKTWVQNVRKHVSKCEAFVKVKKVPRGGGFYWKIHPACRKDFEEGRFCHTIIKKRLGFVEKRSKEKKNKKVLENSLQNHLSSTTALHAESPTIGLASKNVSSPVLCAFAEPLSVSSLSSVKDMNASNSPENFNPEQTKYSSAVTTCAGSNSDCSSVAMTPSAMISPQNRSLNMSLVMNVNRCSALQNASAVCSESSMMNNFAGTNFLQSQLSSRATVTPTTWQNSVSSNNRYYPHRMPIPVFLPGYMWMGPKFYFPGYYPSS